MGFFKKIAEKLTLRNIVKVGGGVLTAGLSLVPGVGGALSKLVAKKEGGSVLGNLIRDIKGNAASKIQSAKTEIMTDTGKMIGTAIVDNSGVVGASGTGAEIAKGVKQGAIIEWVKTHAMLVGVIVVAVISGIVLIIKKKKRWRR